METSTPTFTLADKTLIKARAFCLSERIKIRRLVNIEAISSFPFAFPLEGGCVVLFRFGVVVFFNVPRQGEKAMIKKLKGALIQPFPKASIDEVVIRVDKEAEEGMLQDSIYIKEATLEGLQLVAEVLAKSVVLEYYEDAITKDFKVSEAAVSDLKLKGFKGLNMKRLTHQVSDSLSSLEKMVGFIAVSEKPELLWDYPEKERFYARLEDEYEIKERHEALNRKVELIFRTAQTLIDLLQTKRTLRVEWYIVILIVIEIIIILYDIFI
jgi:uncharacterized Rmd1/YagE family protein